MEYINITIADSGIVIPTLFDPFSTKVIQEILDGDIDLKKIEQAFFSYPKPPQ